MRKKMEKRDRRGEGGITAGGRVHLRSVHGCRRSSEATDDFIEPAAAWVLHDTSPTYL
jgi:hypothetical protein